MYFAAKLLGRFQSAESPTTAIVRYVLRIRRRVVMSSCMSTPSPIVSTTESQRTQSQDRNVKGIWILCALCGSVVEKEISGHSAFAPESFTTFAHLTISAR